MKTPRDEAEYLLKKYGKEDALFCINHLIKMWNESVHRKPSMYWKWKKVKQEIEKL